MIPCLLRTMLIFTSGQPQYIQTLHQLLEATIAPDTNVIKAVSHSQETVTELMHTLFAGYNPAEWAVLQERPMHPGSLRDLRYQLQSGRKYPSESSPCEVPLFMVTDSATCCC